MLRWFLVLLGVATLLGGSSGPTQAAQPKPLALAVCSITKIEPDRQTAKLTASGNCKLKGKYRVPVVWKTSGMVFDHGGHQCGPAQPGSARVFTAKPAVAYRAVVTFTLSAKPRPGLKRAKPVKRTAALQMGGRLAHCGKLDSSQLPPSEAVCTWAETAFGNCGIPSAPGACAWSSPISKNGNTISAGNIVCGAGNCWVQPLRNFGSFNWLGSALSTARLVCADGSVADIYMHYVTLVGPEETCSRTPRYQQFTAFTVPPSWGGELRVMWRIVTITAGDQGGGREVATASFHLDGTANGCPQLNSEGIPWPRSG